MFTFGVIAFIIGSLAFLIALFCLIIGKIMGMEGKGNAIITLVCLATAVAGIFCMGPISITRAAAPTSTPTVSRSVQNDYEPVYDTVATEDIVIPVVTEPVYEDVDVDRTFPEEQSIPVELDYLADEDSNDNNAVLANVDHRGDASNFDTWYRPENQETEATYVLNTSTHKVHYRDCSDVLKIAPDNYATWQGSLAEFYAANPEYTACGHCKPQ